MTITVTIDTNILSKESVIASASSRGVDLYVVTVSDRETEGTKYNEKMNNHTKIIESGCWDDSNFDDALWGSKEDEEMFEHVLSIISNTTFPRDREYLSRGHKRQLRDALIFCAHLREQRDIFVSDDKKAFVNNGKRELLENKYNTKIYTSEEFEAFCTAK